MELNLLIVTIITFVLSMVGCLVLAFISNKLSLKLLLTFRYVHIGLIITSMSLFIFAHNLSLYNYCILITFCSGLLLAGWTLRTNSLKWIKLYFGFFLILIGLFLYSPSLLFYTVSGSLDKMIPPQNFNIKENYYLVEQQSMLSMNSTKVNYKMIQKYGIYKKTIKRDLNFGARIKQVKATSLTKDTIVLSALLNNNIETSIGFNPKQSNKSIKQIRK
jgi:hypothetical protein